MRAISSSVRTACFFTFFPSTRSVPMVEAPFRLRKAALTRWRGMGLTPPAIRSPNHWIRLGIWGR